MVDLVSKDNNEEAPCSYSDLSEEWDVTFLSGQSSILRGFKCY